MDPRKAPDRGTGPLQQTLHGYSEGHRLIESSIQLPDDISRLMLRMSDLSGSNVIPGFEEYLTGYPLESVGMYALAKTWYAREMPRPGCVWTHTLILTEKDLTAPSLASLIATFRRPQNKSAFDSYSQPIYLDSSYLPPATYDELKSNLSWFIVDFYCQKTSPLLIPAKTASEFEPMLLAAWSQQWPSLRRVFSFCTGSLSSRRLGKEPLDVQCVPLQLVRDVQLELKSTNSSLEVALFSSVLEDSVWASVAAQDCLSVPGGEFRRFLWDVAGEDGNREDYPAFVQLYGMITNRHELGEVISLVADCFPSPEKAAHLKKIFFGEYSVRHFFTDVDEASLLAAIGSSSKNGAFDALSLKLRDRGASVAQDYDSARRLIGGLFHAPLNPLGLEVLAGLLLDLESQVAREITHEQPQFLLTLIKAKPSLATSPLIWKSAKDRRWAMLGSIIEDKSIDPDTIKGIVVALLESGTDDLLRWSFDNWGKSAVFAALDWMAANGGWMPDTCRFALTLQLQHVMDWIEETPEQPLYALFSTAQIVAPYSDQICNRNTQVWDTALEEALSRYQESDALQFLTFMLALALGGAPSRPLGLIGDTFEIIHRAELNRHLPDTAWRILEPIVPSVFPHYWDKCERLRRALITSFVTHKWQPTQLRRVITDTDLIKQLMQSAKRVEGGKSYMKEFFR